MSSSSPVGDSYRTEAMRVRNAAQERLKELRAARANRRSGAAAEEQPEKAGRKKPAAKSSASAFTEKSQSGTRKKAEKKPARSRKPKSPAKNTQANAPALTASSAASAVARSVAPAESATETAREPDLQDSDLFKLPGIGPGLVWLFSQAGVLSLADLAAADAEALTNRLGLVGELIDVGVWIEVAATTKSADTA